MCVQKFEVDFFSRFRPWARQVFTTQKPLPTKIHLTMKMYTKLSLNNLLIKLPSVKSEILPFCCQTSLCLKSEYLSLLGYFPFYFIFLLKWNKKEIFNKRMQERYGCRETFLAEVTGNSLSDHYARNVHIKVFLKVAVLWISVRSKILYLNISKFVRKYLQ